jgi:hypothetical protein
VGDSSSLITGQLEVAGRDGGAAGGMRPRALLPLIRMTVVGFLEDWKGRRNGRNEDSITNAIRSAITIRRRTRG